MQTERKDFPSAHGQTLAARLDAPSGPIKAYALLIGHSLGGAAVLATASAIAEVKAAVTIAAPSDPGHAAGKMRRMWRQ